MVYMLSKILLFYLQLKTMKREIDEIWILKVLVIVIGFVDVTHQLT